jgi:hypothetical protein
MAKGAKTGGRVKGTPNKLTVSVKEAIEHVAVELGGADAMLAWVRSDPANERIFYSQIYTKLLPKNIEATLTGADGGPIAFTKIERTIVRPTDTDT